MNRAEKRRQKKLAKKATRKAKLGKAGVDAAAIHPGLALAAGQGRQSLVPDHAVVPPGEAR